MKNLIGMMVSVMAVSGSALAEEAHFNSLICHNYDYYQLGGDRKALEIAVTKDSIGKYTVTVSRTYEVLQENRQYIVRDRVVETDFKGLKCLQASLPEDPKVVTCAAGSPHLDLYFRLARLDRTGISSSFSTDPGRIIKSMSYEAAVYDFGDKQNEYSGFSPDDCVLN